MKLGLRLFGAYHSFALALPFPRGAKAKAAVLARGREAATLRDGLDDSIRARTEAPGPCPPASPWRGAFACRRCPRPRAPPRWCRYGSPRSARARARSIHSRRPSNFLPTTIVAVAKRYSAHIHLRAYPCLLTFLTRVWRGHVMVWMNEGMSLISPGRAQFRTQRYHCMLRGQECCVRCSHTHSLGNIHKLVPQTHMKREPPKSQMCQPREAG